MNIHCIKIAFIASIASLAAVGCSESDPQVWLPTGDFREPVLFEPDSEGVYQLSVGPNEVTIAGKRYCLRSYNGELTGPTIRIPPREGVEPRRIRVNFRNNFTKADIKQVGMQEFDFNETNLHTHGLHVRPDRTADDMFMSDNVLVRYGAQETEEFRFDIDEGGTHEAGTFWYHAHVHGTTAIQVANGMAGALIIEGPVDGIASVADANERIFLFQQIPYNEAEPLGDDEECTEDNLSINEFSIVTRSNSTLINGVLRPRLEMVPMQVERWRFIDAGIARELQVRIIKAQGDTCERRTLEGLEMHQIAADGYTYMRRDTRERVALRPGYRADVMVQAPAEEGVYCVIDDKSDGLHEGEPEDVDLLAVLHVVADGEPTGEIPSDNELASVARPPLDCPEVSEFDQTMIFAQQEDADGNPCEGQTANGQPLFNINCREFDPERPRILDLGQTENWYLTSERGNHPFHIHVNHFTVCSTGDDGELAGQPHWKDTLFVPNGSNIHVRSEYKDFTGRFVLHCHILNHEDQNMMELVEIQ